VTVRLFRNAVVLLALVAALAGGWARAAETFVPGVDDLPLMPGLSAMAGQSVVFDAPGGRVIEAWAEGAVSQAAVLSFYGSTLPQLGWTPAAPDFFRRDGETLRLDFPVAGNRTAEPVAAGALLVRFYLSPG
jgi:hypothetical protein